MTPDELPVREEVARFRLHIPLSALHQLDAAVDAAWPDADLIREQDGWLVVYRPVKEER